MKNMKFIKKALSLFIAVTIAVSLPCQTKYVSAHSENTIADSGERTAKFDDDWMFQLEPAGNVFATDYDDSKWRNLTLPHDWSIEQKFDSKISTGVGALKGGTGWYRKHFILPDSYSGKRISIDFDGVYQDSYIYVNGELVGNYPNGYVPFSFDITDYVVCDGITENIIAVRVTNVTNENNEGYTSRWYSGSGIYRDVYLTVTDDVHVQKYGTVITTPDLEEEYSTGKVTVNVKTTVDNEGITDANVSVRNTIMNYKGESEFVGASPVESGIGTITNKSSMEVEQQIIATNPKLWSTEAPTLYRMKTEVFMNGQIVDSYETRFGFKWCYFDSNKGFSLNGRSMKLQGVCLHHDQGSLGSVGYTAAFRRQLTIMKNMGVNAVRTSHNTASPEFMRLCDEMGIMVFEESFDSWWDGKNNSDYGKQFFMNECTYPGVEPGTTWAKYDLQSIVKKDINCPSIIMWSIGNECAETTQTKAIEYVKEVVNWVKEIDETHYVTMGENKYKVSWSTPSIMKQVDDSLDLVGLNYGEMYYDSLHEEKPDWKIFGSETTSTVSSRGYYASPWISGNHAVDNVDGNYAQDAVAGRQLSCYDNRTARFGRNVTEALIFDRDREFIGGQFVWTGFDYIGEPTPLDGTAKSSYFGIVDTAGFAKDRYYLYQSQWTSLEDNPMVHIMPHWNWENDSMRNKVTYPEKSTLDNLDPKEVVNYSDDAVGKIPMRIYSNAPTVELFVDGVSQGKKSFAQKVTDYGRHYQQQSEDSDRLYLEWPLTWNYYPGTTIEAIAYDGNGNIVAKDEVVTADSPARLKTTADRAEIVSDGLDLSYITVDVCDENGNFAPNASNEITFDIEGNGEIVGVDNGDPTSRENYKDTNGIWKRSAFSGKALVIVRSTDDAGSFTLTASSNGLESSSVTVETDEEKQYIEQPEPTPTASPAEQDPDKQVTVSAPIPTSSAAVAIAQSITGNTVSKAATVKKFTKNNVKYSVLSTKKKTVQITGITKKGLKKVKIPARISNSGVKYKVVKIAAGAFKNCRKLTKVILGKNIKTLSYKSLKGINRKAVIHLPACRASLYKKLLKKHVNVVLEKEK